MCALLCSASPASVCLTILGVWPQVQPDHFISASEGAHARVATRTTAEVQGGTVSPLVSWLVAAAQPAEEPSPTPLDSQRKAEIEAEIAETVRWFLAASALSLARSLNHTERAEASRYPRGLESRGCKRHD